MEAVLATDAILVELEAVEQMTSQERLDKLSTSRKDWEVGSQSVKTG